MFDLPAVRFFTSAEESTAGALLDRLVGQHDADQALGDHIDLVRMVDARLAEDQTDGWNYDTMPPDPEAWRRSLAALDEEARARFGTAFGELAAGRQDELIESVRTWEGEAWHGLPPSGLWSLWTRYAATAFYSHPLAWNEIGFDGPAYPAGYKNLGVNRLEGIETRDARAGDDPAAREER